MFSRRDFERWLGLMLKWCHKNHAEGEFSYRDVHGFCRQELPAHHLIIENLSLEENPAFKDTLHAGLLCFVKERPVRGLPIFAEGNLEAVQFAFFGSHA